MARIFYIVLSLGLFSLTGCGAVQTGFSNEQPQLVAAPDSVSLMLAEAATKASTALETLAAVEQAKSPGVAVAPITNAPIELRRAMTISWAGPVEALVRALATRAGYVFYPLGVAPAVPIVISVDAENKPVIEILRDVGLQLGARGDIRVDSQQRTVELHYPPATTAGQGF